MKTVQNLEQVRLVSSIHNENNKNDKEVLGIIISKNTSLDFCCENTLVKIRKKCAKLSAYGKYFLKNVYPRFNQGRYIMVFFKLA